MTRSGTTSGTSHRLTCGAATPTIRWRASSACSGATTATSISSVGRRRWQEEMLARADLVPPSRPHLAYGDDR